MFDVNVTSGYLLVEKIHFLLIFSVLPITYINYNTIVITKYKTFVIIKL